MVLQAAFRVVADGRHRDNELMQLGYRASDAPSPVLPSSHINVFVFLEAHASC
jgi:hypothetical protein